MRTLQTLAILALIYGANALDNGLARTPPMGWRSWNAYGAKINQDLMENAADMMVDNSRGFSLKGGASISPAPFAYCSFRFSDRGYTRVGLDDYYQLCGAGAGGTTTRGGSHALARARDAQRLPRTAAHVAGHPGAPPCGC